MLLNNNNYSIIILINTLLFPVRRNGMSVRYLPVVRGLAEKGYTVDVLIINKYHEKYSSQDTQGLRRYCRYVDVIEPVSGREKGLPRLLLRLRNAVHLLPLVGQPYGLVDNQRDYNLAKIRGILATRKRYDAGIGVSVGGNNADLLLSLPETIRPCRIICDFIDSAYLLKRRARTCNNRIVGWLGLLEERKTRQWERAICQRCPCVYISQKDSESTGGLGKVIPNSVVADGYETAAPIALEHPNIAFLGNMAYPPNIEAATWLSKKLFPHLRKSLPSLKCYIIGRNPGDDLRRLCMDQGIHITGEVDNIWDYIRSVDVFVFPLFSGAGQQNKVLEAMYAGKTVICTPIANEGIGAVHGENILLASNRAEFLASIQVAISNDSSIGKNAHDFVRARFSIDSVIDSYEALLAG